MTLCILPKISEIYFAKVQQEVTMFTSFSKCLRPVMTQLFEISIGARQIGGLFELIFDLPGLNL